MSKFLRCGLVFLSLLVAVFPVQAKQPKGWLYPLYVDRDLWEEHRIEVSAQVQAGFLQNDNGSENVFPTGFFSINEGFVLNRITLAVEKPLRTNYIPRVGPLPKAMPTDWDWGFVLEGRYGEDFSRTYGFDDEMGINEGNRRKLLLPQWFVKGYAPIGAGTTFQFGTWFTNVGNEIGAPIDPPSPFYTHPYAMMYAPSKHFGGLLSTKLPISDEYGLWGMELGLVQGWNNVQDNNDEKSLITSLQWRSKDMRTWIDFESIWGNEQSEQGITDQRPFVAVSSNKENLFRQFHSLTLKHSFGEQRDWQVILNGVYGDQEGGDVAADANNPPGFLITEDSQWHGVNGTVLWKMRNDLQLGLRAEWFTDKEGAYFLLPGGDYQAWTANASWYPQPWLRVRPELRYDRYNGDGKPFGGTLPTLFNGSETEQWLFSIDATVFL